MVNVNKTIIVGDTKYTVLFDDVVPPISEEEYESLKEDISENGILVPPIIDEKNGIIDGVNRIRAISELKRKSFPCQILPNLVKGQEKRDLAIKINALRRQWSKEDRLKLAVSLRKQKYSYRRIASIINLNHETVRKHLIASGERFPDKSEGKDGIEKPARLSRSTCILVRNSKEAKEVSENLKKINVNNLPDTVLNSHRLGRIVRNEEAKANPTCKDIQIGTAKLLFGSFQERGKEIASESVKMLITDPPYREESLPLFNDLGEFAARVLKPGGILLSYSGTMFLPDVYAMLGKHLKYWWTFAIEHTGGNKSVYNLHIHQCWKPVVAYIKEPVNVYWNYLRDMVSGKREKDVMDWQQCVSEAEYFIKHLCPQKGILVDPMAGAATSLIAGMNLGMDCIGIENNPSTFALAEKRIKEHKDAA